MPKRNMLDLQVSAYRVDDAARWDDFVETSWNGTLLHSRRFLDYHGDRFIERSLLVEAGDGRLLGVFPAAAFRGDERRIWSHPGSTYGGLVHDRGLKGEGVVDALRLIVTHYAALRAASLVYKAVPAIYHRTPASDDCYAMVSLGAKFSRCDLAATIDLTSRSGLPKGRASALKRARRAGIELREGLDELPRFWSIVEANLSTQHRARPTHSLAEITDLFGRLPDKIGCLVGVLDGETVGGILLFDAGPVLVTQYIASTDVGRSNCVLDLIIDAGIALAKERGKRYFSFGTSMEDGRLNAGLHYFKTSFGAGGVAHNFYELCLQSAASAHQID